MEIFKIENIVGTILGYPISYVELIGTVSGLLSVWFATKQNIWTWPIGLINVIFFFAIFYQVQLYSDMLLQIFFFIASIYGWVIWGKEKKTEEPIALLSKHTRIKFILIITILTIGLGFFTSKIHLLFPNVFSNPAAFPFTDAFTTIASIIATILMAKRYLESWILWILVDIVSITIYSFKQILFISFEYGIFLILAIMGFILWNNTLKNEKRFSIG